MSRFSSPVAGSSEVAVEAVSLDAFEERARAAVQAAELELDLARTRLMSRYGAPVWAGFAIYDIMQASRPGVGHLPELLFLRAAGTLLLAALAVWGQRTTRGSRSRIEIGTTTAGLLLCTTLSLMSLYDGGFASVYSPGIVIVMFAMASLPRPFRRCLRLNLLVILPYPLVMGLAAVFSPRHAALFREQTMIAAAVQFTFTLLTCVLFAAMVSHALWSLRRQLLAAQSLGRYQLTRSLGHGPQGEVLVAYHYGLRRDVAVKVLSRSDVHDPGYAARFEQTMYVLGGLTHPNTVRLFDFGLSAEGRPYFAMELLQGETLRSLIEREGKLNVTRATRLMLQVARSLSEAHARGIVHQNLKAENVFVTALGDQPDFVKVVDYALVPPDANWHAFEPTPAGDVYACGALYFQLLTGEPVRKDDLLGAEHERAPSPSARLGARLPDRVESLIVRCLESDPAERFCNARELASELEACVALIESTAARESAAPARRKLHSNEVDTDPTRVDPSELGRLFSRAATDDSDSVVSSSGG